MTNPFRTFSFLAVLSLVAVAAGCGRKAPPGGEPRRAPANTASAEVEGKPHEGPKFELSRLEHDFGEVVPGSSHALTLRANNKGSRELTLTRENTRGNVVLHESELRIPPGESRPLTITVSAPQNPGAFSASVGFRTNDPDQPSVLWKGSGVVGAATTPPLTGLTLPGETVAALPKPKPGDKQPSLTVESSGLDAGVIKKGKPATFVFKVKNSGEAEAQINAKPGCGCTVAKYDEKIAPGATGSIRATLDTKTFSGKVTKSITVTTNDPKHPTLQLTISADVTPPVQVLPSDRHYWKVFEGESATHEFSLYSNDPGPFLIKSVTDSSGKLNTELVPAQIPVPGKAGKKKQGYRLRVTVPKDLPARAFASTLTVETNNKDEPTVNLTVSGNVQKEIAVVPSTLFFVVRGEKERPTRQLSVTKRSGKFKVTKVDVHGQPLKAEVSTAKEGSSYGVDLTYTGGWKPGFVNGTITVHTDDPAQSAIEVPLTASIILPNPSTGGKP